jgi:hypothetical protein
MGVEELRGADLSTRGPGWEAMHGLEEICLDTWSFIQKKKN